MQIKIYIMYIGPQNPLKLYIMYSQLYIMYTRLYIMYIRLYILYISVYIMYIRYSHRPVTATRFRTLMTACCALGFN